MRKPKFKKSLIILLGLTFFQSTALAEDESYTLPPKHSESFPQRLWNEPKQTISQLAYSSAEAIVYGWPKSLTTLVGAIGAAAAWKSYQTGAGWSGPVGAGLLGGAGGFAVAEVADKFTPEPVRQATIEVLTDSKQMFSQAKKSLVNYLSSGSDNPREPARQIVVTDPVLSEQLQKQKEAIELLEREFQLSEQRNKDTIDELQRQLEASKADSALNLGGGHGGREPPHPVVLSLADQVEKNTASIKLLLYKITSPLVEFTASLIFFKSFLVPKTFFPSISVPTRFTLSSIKPTISIPAS